MAIFMGFRGNMRVFFGILLECITIIWEIYRMLQCGYLSCDVMCVPNKGVKLDVLDFHGRMKLEVFLYWSMSYDSFYSWHQFSKGWMM